MKTRLLGAAVLLALLVLFVPMFFSSTPPAPGADQTVSLAIPPAPDRDLQTKTMSLTPDAPVSTPNTATSPGSNVSSSSAIPSTAPSASVTPSTITTAMTNGVATVEINAKRPVDVQAAATPEPSTQPIIRMQNKPSGGMPGTRQIAVASAPPKPTKSPERAPAAAAAAVVAQTPVTTNSGHGSYMLNLSAYANVAGAASLVQRVHGLGYPVNGHLITQAGQSRTLVLAGPFDTRAAAEAARLKITQSVPGVPAHLQQDAGQSSAPTSVAAPRVVAAKAAASALPAAAAPANSPSKGKGHAGGFAVQVAAMSSQGDATALRDKLRSNGFDGFVDSAQSGGKQIYRVRAGPQTQRADAQRLHDQIKAKLGIDGNVVSMP